MGMRFALKGTREVTRNLRQAAKNMPDLLEAAAFLEFQVEQKEVERRTPVDTGNLQDSFEVVTEWVGRSLFVHIITDVEYAPIVHEDMDAFHPVGQAKFLESVLDESAPYMARRIAERMSDLQGILS